MRQLLEARAQSVASGASSIPARRAWRADSVEALVAEQERHAGRVCCRLYSARSTSAGSRDATRLAGR